MNKLTLSAKPAFKGRTLARVSPDTKLVRVALFALKYSVHLQILARGTKYL